MSATDIIDAVCQSSEVRREDVLGPSRFSELVEARREIASRLRARGWTLARIGRLFGKHHSSVLYWLKNAPTPGR